MATLVLARGFQWKRSSAISATLALHALAVLAILAPPAFVAVQKASEPLVQPITLKREEPPPPPPPVLEVVRHKPKAPVVRAPPRPEPVRADPIITAEPTTMSYPPVADPAPIAEPAAPIETAPSAPGYKSMKTVPYPRIAAQQRMEGTVILRVLVGADGVPQEIQIDKSSGHVVLDRAARDAVMKWRFEPGTRNGEPFAAYGLVPIAFKLTEL